MYGPNRPADKATLGQAFSGLLGEDPGDPWAISNTGFFAGQTILITGAGGSIGKELCKHLVGLSPKRLLMFEICEFALYELLQDLSDFAENQQVDLVPVLGSIVEERQVRALFNDYRIDTVLHAAAYKHVPLAEQNVLSGIKNNVVGTQVLARAAHEAGATRMILVSTDKAIRPAGAMGRGKRLAELIVADLATRSRTVFSVVRFGNVLGSSGSVVPKFARQIAAGGPITITDSRATRYFMTVQEAVGLVLCAAELAGGGEVFTFDMGRPKHIIDLAHQMIAASGLTVRNRENPAGDIALEETGLRPGEKCHEECLLGPGLMTTAHPKIFVAPSHGLSEIETAAAMRDLQLALEQWDPEALRRVLVQCIAKADGHDDPFGRGSARSG